MWKYGQSAFATSRAFFRATFDNGLPWFCSSRSLFAWLVQKKEITTNRLRWPRAVHYMVACRYGISLLVFNSISPSERSERVRYSVEHLKRNTISPRAHVLLSISSLIMHKDSIVIEPKTVDIHTFTIAFCRLHRLHHLDILLPQSRSWKCTSPQSPIKDFVLSWTQDFGYPKSWIQDFGFPKSWIQDFGFPKSWIQEFGYPKSWIQDFGLKLNSSSVITLRK